MTRILPEDVIPHGMYCYKRTDFTKIGAIEVCPFFARVMSDDQEAYCLYLAQTDFLLLDDHCKICGVNDD